ncbi:ribonuclease BN [Intrasporangium chromatireducens Q5-1]|uniref:Ribonuclease BN n=1 Tax=Intrasporangium chromatireducens Q5-1 TaxID=584657 RepID=W9GK50_9MICO|nr:YihY/virulence factor BrkB family protein [Intrasporangium chromatireducens]EWT05198.1 ribonuclease BN [Intrasporangium chromatireducens Q5-1]
MAVLEGVDRFQRRHPAANFPLAVLYKYFDDFGPHLAALIAYYAFVSLFPLLLLLATVLGFLLAGDPALQQKVLHSTLAQFPVVGTQLGDPKRLGGGTTGVVVGILGSLYGGLGVAQAVQYAMNTAWRVPRNSRPNPFKARGRSVVLLATAGLAVLGTTALSALGTPGTGPFEAVGKGVTLAGAVLLNVTLFVFVFRFATTRDLSSRDVLPGAIAAAIAWQLLQSFGVIYVSRVVKNASATNGVFAVVLGMLAFLYLTAAMVVLCVEINVVRTDRLHPRSLLTPFTDNVRLTRADRRSYTRQAQAERSKGFEEVHVSFDEPPQQESERPRQESERPRQEQDAPEPEGGGPSNRSS